MTCMTRGRNKGGAVGFATLAMGRYCLHTDENGQPSDCSIAALRKRMGNRNDSHTKWNRLPDPPACKRSRTRSQARFERAALSLQHWYRRSLQTLVWDMDTACNLPRLWRNDLIKIVEPNGIEYHFVARVLALYVRRAHV